MALRVRVTRFERVAFLRQRKNAECIARGIRFPGRCPGLWAAIGLTARPNHCPRLLAMCKTPLLSFNYVLVYLGVQCLEGTTKA